MGGGVCLYYYVYVGSPLMVMMGVGHLKEGVLFVVWYVYV